jgi:hypothetical protein
MSFKIIVLANNLKRHHIIIISVTSLLTLEFGQDDHYIWADSSYRVIVSSFDALVEKNILLWYIKVWSFCICH